MDRLLKATPILVAAFALALTACSRPGTRVVDAESPTPMEATEEASAEAQPSVGSSPAAVGERIRIGDEQYFTVHEVTLWPGNDFITQNPGQKFVALRVEIEGISADGTSHDTDWFSVKDESGVEYDPTAFSHPPVLWSGNDLRPGDIAAGWMTFEVPAETTELTVTYQPDFLGSGEPARVLIPVPSG